MRPVIEPESPLFLAIRQKFTFSEIAADIDAGPAKHHCSYVYLGRGLTDKTVKDTALIAFDMPDDHDRDGVNVLYGDGHADWETPPAVIKLVPPNLIPDDPRWRRAAEAVGLPSTQATGGSR